MSTRDELKHKCQEILDNPEHTLEEMMAAADVLTGIEEEEAYEAAKCQECNEGLS